jgi:hypothetical protein
MIIGALTIGHHGAYATQRDDQDVQEPPRGHTRPSATRLRRGCGVAHRLLATLALSIGAAKLAHAATGELMPPIPTTFRCYPHRLTDCQCSQTSVTDTDGKGGPGATPPPTLACDSNGRRYQSWTEADDARVAVRDYRSTRRTQMGVIGAALTAIAGVCATLRDAAQPHPGDPHTLPQRPPNTV